MTDHHVDWSMCPYCGVVHDAAMNMTGTEAPTDGDPGICIVCLRVAVFEAGHLGGRRIPTNAEIAKFSHDTVLMATLDAMVSARRRIE